MGQDKIAVGSEPQHGSGHYWQYSLAACHLWVPDVIRITHLLLFSPQPPAFLAF